MTPAGRRLLVGELRGRRRPLAVMAAWTLAEALQAALSVRLIAGALDGGFLVHRPLTGLGWLLAFGLVTVVGAFGARQVYPPLADIVEPLRDSLTHRVVDAALRRPAGRAARPDTAAVARLARQIETVRECLAGQLLIIRHFAVTLVFVLIGTASLSPALLPLVAGPPVLALTAFVLLLPRLAARQHELLHAEEELAARAADTFGALRDVVACGAVGRAGTDLDATVTRQLRARHRIAALAAGRRLTVAVGAHLPAALVLLAAPSLLRDHRLTAGQVVGALGYLTVSLEPALRTLVQGLSASGLRLSVAAGPPTRAGGQAGGPGRVGVGVRTLVQGLGPPGLRLSVAAERLAAATAHQPGPPPAPGPGTPPAPRPASAARRPRPPALELTDLAFAHQARAEPVLGGLTLTLAEGEHLAVVGPSGIGKSTLADLLAGLAEPTRGTVRLRGRPLARIAPGELPSLRVLIPQEAYVFTGTLRENLTQLRPAARTAQLESAAEQLGLTELLRRTGGLDAPLDPHLLSAGERQLVAATRAFLSPAALALLDEATSHLDPAAEAVVEEAFRARPGTLLVIAHRISSAERADRVLLLDTGGPVIGTPRELAAHSSGYRDLLGHWTAGLAAGER
ncbi:ABC transporter ATP-binding protein [Kitasatospora nipponensis]|uniref:ABC transporter ATP-binding protein n=1 Tax=Kitasatospora nipponensis TaxID=258049 RepID=A0ABN1T7I3_9ACTN